MTWYILKRVGEKRNTDWRMFLLLFNMETNKQTNNKTSISLLLGALAKFNTTGFVDKQNNPAVNTIRVYSSLINAYV